MWDSLGSECAAGGFVVGGCPACGTVWGVSVQQVALWWVGVLCVGQFGE